MNETTIETNRAKLVVLELGLDAFDIVEQVCVKSGSQRLVLALDEAKKSLEKRHRLDQILASHEHEALGEALLRNKNTTT